MNSLLKWLKRPYPHSRSWKSSLITGIAISLFVFLFLRLFQPFGLHNEFPYKTLIIGGFGLVTFIAYGIYVFLLPNLFPQFFREENWTVGKNLSITMLTVLSIALGNFLYTTGVGFASLTWQTALGFLINTFMVGFFPITITVIITEMRLMKLHHSASEAVNRSLQHAPAPASPVLPSLEISNEEGKVELTLAPQDLLYIASADNYVEIHYAQAEQNRKQLIRSTMRRMEEQLQDHPELLRCHRSYLVNLQHVRHSEGNSAGLRLDLGIERKIPVSRSYVGRFKSALEAQK